MKNKTGSILLSIAVAFLLWYYVISVVSPGSTETIYDIPVVFEGETALTEDRAMMITSRAEEVTVDLKLSGNRTDLAKVNKGNITIKVNLARVYDPGQHELTYDIIFPGDVPVGALTTEVKTPEAIKLTVEKRVRKPVDVRVNFTGSAAENFMADTENRILDYPTVNVVGPSSVVDLIDHARIDVDLTGRMESVSENFRYTLCDADGNPVDVEMVTTDVGEIHLDVKIHKVKEVKLSAEVIYGGGATEKNTTVEIEPAVIRLSGGSAVLEELGDSISLGKIDLRTIEKSQEFTIPITLPEAVTNLSNIAEAKVNVRFTGLLVKEFEVETIEAVNVPEGLEVEIMEKKITVALRGTAMDLSKILAEDIVVRADFTGAVAGTSTFKATVHFADELPAIGAIRSYSVTANLTEKE